ncbi:MAG TPA: AI-2E family transporter [Anaerolineales bacterium]|nr:AI-2E family transporter [Anaerolineales bacterium]
MISKANQKQSNPKWSRATRLWVTLITLIIAGWIFVVSLPLIEALLIAALLAFLIDPIVRWIMDHLKLNRAKASTLVYIVFLLIIASIPTGLGTLVYGLAKRWFSDFPAAAAELERFFTRPIILFGYIVSPSVVLEDLRQSITDVLGSLPGGSLDVLSGMTTNLMWALLILVSLYYLLKDGPKLRPWLISLALPEYHEEIDRLLEELLDVWGLFLRAQILIFFVLALLLGISSLVVIWLYQTGLIRFSTIGLILVMVVIYTLVQQVDNLWLRPQLMGRQLHIHPGLVFIGLIGALALSGILGALLIIPAIASAKVLVKYLYNKMLGLPAWPEPDELEDEEQEDQKQLSSQVS